MRLTGQRTEKSAARFGTRNGKMKSEQRTPAAFTRAENELKTEPVTEEIKNKPAPACALTGAMKKNRENRSPIGKHQI
jgi:hypothetical protein